MEFEQTRSSLLRRVRNLDDATGWEEFDRLYRPMLVGYARRRGLRTDEAEEIAQQCLTAIVARIQTFERRRSYRAWLRGMVDHKVSDHLADRQRHRRADTDQLARTPGPAEPPESLWQQEWNQTHLTYCIDCLRADFASHTLQAFAMYVLEDQPVPHISRCLGLTPNQIYVAKSRVMARLRERFGDLIDGLYGAGP